MSPKSHQKYVYQKIIGTPLVTKRKACFILAKETGFPIEYVRVIIDGWLKVAVDVMGEGGRLLMPGFGTFYAREYKSRPAYDMGRRKHLVAPAQCVPFFKPSIELKKEIREKVKPKLR